MKKAYAEAIVRMFKKEMTEISSRLMDLQPLSKSDAVLPLDSQIQAVKPGASFTAQQLAEPLTARELSDLRYVLVRLDASGEKEASRVLTPILNQLEESVAGVRKVVSSSKRRAHVKRLELSLAEIKLQAGVALQHDGHSYMRNTLSSIVRLVSTAAIVSSNDEVAQSKPAKVITHAEPNAFESLRKLLISS